MPLRPEPEPEPELEHDQTDSRELEMSVASDRIQCRDVRRENYGKHDLCDDIARVPGTSEG